jgi:hypothetical protein
MAGDDWNVREVGETKLKVVEGTVCRIGTMNFAGAPFWNSPAELVIINRIAIGMLFPVKPDIRKILAKPETGRDPIDLNRLDKHLNTLIEEGYVAAYQDALDYRFDIDTRENWLVSSGYLPMNGHHYRSYIIHAERNNLCGGEIATHLRAMSIGPIGEPWTMTVDPRAGDDDED